MTLFEAYVTNAGKYADYGVDPGADGSLQRNY